MPSKNSTVSRRKPVSRRTSSRKKKQTVSRPMPVWLRNLLAFCIIAVFSAGFYWFFIRPYAYRWKPCYGLKGYGVCMPCNYEVHGIDIYHYQARQNGCRLALLRLKQLLNLHAEDTLAVQDTINYELLSAYPLPQTEELYTQSLVAMPSMRMMELRQRAARKEYAMAGGKFSPTVFARFSMASRYLDGFSTKQLNDNLGKYIGIGISIPLLSGLERLTTLRKHKLNIFRLRNEEELQKQQLYTEVEQTVLSLRSGYDEFRQVLQQFRAEELVLKESERKWEEGLISVFQLMEARNRFISSKAELARVRLQVDMTLKMETYYRTGSFCTLPGEE